ncbi:MAG: Omp28-related outer membrane protein [Bacteroidia bacterium]
MINKSIFLILIILVFSSCEEEPVGINYKPATTTYDTTYILEVTPSAQVKEILIEDITGVSCPNCPEAAQIAAGIVSANPGRVNVMALYNTISSTLGYPIDHPPVKSQFDFRNILATEICQFVAVPGNLPNGYINRKKFTGKLDAVVPKEEWVSFSNAEIALTTPVNIEVHATYDNTTKDLVTDVTVTYTSNVSGDNYISMCILEDSVVDAQESKDPGSGAVTYLQDYTHRHILRDMYTASIGDLLNTSNSITLTRGRVIKRRYSKKVEKLVPYSHWKILAFVTEDPTSKYVLHSKEAEVE